MLVIRLTRVGKKNNALFRLIVQEKRQSPGSKALEIVGNYNPNTDPSTITLKEDRVKYWISQGAQPSATVHNMFVNLGLIKGKKQKVVKIKRKKEEGAPASPSAPKPSESGAKKSQKEKPAK